MKIAKFSEYIPFIDIYGRSKDKEKQMPTCIGGRFANVFSEEKKKNTSAHDVYVGGYVILWRLLVIGDVLLGYVSCFSYNKKKDTSFYQASHHHRW